MNRHPNEYWLKYLLTFTTASLSEVSSAAEMYRMVAPPTSYLKALRTSLESSKPSPFDIRNATTRAWTRRQRMMSMTLNEPAVVGARTILSDNKIRPVFESLILADASIADIVKYTRAITGQTVTQEVVEKYRHYFWNRELLSMDEWSDYLKGYPNGKSLMSCYNQGLEFALWRLGYRVELTKQEILNNILHESAMRFAELNSSNNSMNTSIAAKNWADCVFKSIEALEKTGDSVKKVVDDLREISIKLGRRDISSIESLNRKPPEEDE